MTRLTTITSYLTLNGSAISVPAGLSDAAICTLIEQGLIAAVDYDCGYAPTAAAQSIWERELDKRGYIAEHGDDDYVSGG